MYRYGDGTPFPLEENFIETLTAAVEACTNAFMPLTELDGRRERARAGRADADRELSKLAELEKTLNGALAPYLVPDRKGGQTQVVSQKLVSTAKDAIRQSRTQVESRVQALGQARCRHCLRCSPPRAASVLRSPSAAEREVDDVVGRSRRGRSRRRGDDRGAADRVVLVAGRDAAQPDSGR